MSVKTKHCTICGTPLTGKQIKYCSKKCKERAKYLRHRPAVLARHRRYKHSPRGKIAVWRAKRKYRKTKKGKECAKRASRKYRKKIRSGIQ